MRLKIGAIEPDHSGAGGRTAAAKQLSVRASALGLRQDCAVTSTNPDTTHQVELDAVSKEYLDALDDLTAASEQVHQALREAAHALSLVREHIERGGHVSDFTDLIQPAPLRTLLSTSLDNLERKRHRTQRLLFKILCNEGKSMAEIGRAWGISRQLVSRLINEAEPPPTSGERPGN